MNVGTPAWSDKYKCAEWAMFNNILSAMALGNHDADYGPDVFAQCQAQITYPILSANTLDAGGRPMFLHDGKNYVVFETNGVKIGVFAVAGPDFGRLTRPETRPAGATFGDRIEAARQVVSDLRGTEQVNAVVLIGHSLREDDIALAQAVPGIDIIFGSHSHRKEDLFTIPGTNTRMISSFQYLTYVSRLELVFTGGALSDVRGGLVRMSNDLPEDPQIAQTVAQMQRDLENDPQYASLFQVIGAASSELSTEGQFQQDAALGNFVMDILREAGQAHLALSTSSSFREPIPPGTITEEALRTAMPYTNRILVYQLPGAVVQELLNYSVSRAGSDFFSQVAGVRFNIVGGQATNIQVHKNPAKPGEGYVPLDMQATYSVATTNFQGLIAGGYKDIFAKGTYTDTKIDVRDTVRAYIQQHSPISGAVDGRMTIGAPAAAPVSNQPPVADQPPVPVALPDTGGTEDAPLAVLILAATSLLGGLLLRWRVKVAMDTQVNIS